jgi:hypothetical protein
MPSIERSASATPWARQRSIRARFQLEPADLDDTLRVTAIWAIATFAPHARTPRVASHA